METSFHSLFRKYRTTPCVWQKFQLEMEGVTSLVECCCAVDETCDYSRWVAMLIWSIPKVKYCDIILSSNPHLSVPKLIWKLFRGVTNTQFSHTRLFSTTCSENVAEKTREKTLFFVCLNIGSDALNCRDILCECYLRTLRSLTSIFIGIRLAMVDMRRVFFGQK